jgi:anti-sigma factor RsiW
MMKCYAVRKRIADYVDGLLAPALMQRVEDHLDACDGCRRECDGLRETVRLVSRWGRLHCPADCRSVVLSRISAAPSRGTRFSWPSLPLIVRAGFAATATAGAVAALVVGLSFRSGAPGPGIVIPPPHPPQGAAVVDLPEWHDANRTQQALGTTDSLVLEIPGGSGARAQTRQ